VALFLEKGRSSERTSRHLCGESSFDARSDIPPVSVLSLRGIGLLQRWEKQRRVACGAWIGSVTVGRVRVRVEVVHDTMFIGEARLTSSLIFGLID
jgi:hypothetical protein